MTPAPSESLALQHVKLSDVLEIIFEFHPGLPRVWQGSLGGTTSSQDSVNNELAALYKFTCFHDNQVAL